MKLADVVEIILHVVFANSYIEDLLNFMNMVMFGEYQLIAMSTHEKNALEDLRSPYQIL